MPEARARIAPTNRCGPRLFTSASLYGNVARVHTNALKNPFVQPDGKPIAPHLRQPLAVALLKFFQNELSANKEGTTHPDWSKRHKAANLICDMVGVGEVVKAIAFDGALRPPPTWPLIDVVPVSGGVGFLTAAVRTTHPQKGKLAINMRLQRPAHAKHFDRTQIIEAYERGRFELKRVIEGG